MGLLIIGIVIGIFVAVWVWGLCCIAHDSDHQMAKMWENMEEDR